MSGVDRRLKIVIGCPCYGKVDPELLEDWIRWAYHCGRRLPQFDFFTAIKTKSEQFRARNAIVEAAVQVGADYLLMIDDDMIISTENMVGPDNSYSLLEKLLSHKKDICGVRYYQREGECNVVLMLAGDGKGYRFLRDDEVTGGLQRVDVAGGGCLLINMKVFDKIKQPYFQPEFQYGTDIQLCRAAAEAGFEVWADTSIELGHLRSSKVVVTSKTRHLYKTADMIPGEVRQKFVPVEMYDNLIQDGLEYTGYGTLEDMQRVWYDFLKEWTPECVNDLQGWYGRFPKERVARQVVFNTQFSHKRQMTEYIICSISHQRPLRILDFGCGIGLTAFELARLGHSVTAMDLDGTETLKFLRWRVMQHRVPITSVPLRTDQWLDPYSRPSADLYDVIIAMDVLEHIPDWRGTLKVLAESLRWGGFLFANNAILEDDLHPEHLEVDPKAFLQECVANDLLPANQLTYHKREVVHHGVTNPVKGDFCGVSEVTVGGAKS